MNIVFSPLSVMPRDVDEAEVESVNNNGNYIPQCDDQTNRCCHICHCGDWQRTNTCSKTNTGCFKQRPMYVPISTHTAGPRDGHTRTTATPLEESSKHLEDNQMRTHQMKTTVINIREAHIVQMETTAPPPPPLPEDILA